MSQNNGWNRLGDRLGDGGSPGLQRMESREATGKAVSQAPGQPTHYSQTVGERGPVLAQDGVLHETLEEFVHSTTRGRVVHTKGCGAFGVFRPTYSMAGYTTASLFQTPGQEIPVAVRFSLAVSNPGTPDTSRNVRALSTKFYTGEGTYDLLCNHIPVFLVRDGARFPESIRAFQPSPVNQLADPNRFWGFVASAPEAVNFVIWLYSDLGTVKNLRQIRTYGVNTYVWKNREGVRHYVKYHWLPMAGEANISQEEAVRLAGENPDIAARDLYDTIAAGTPVEYILCVQLMTPEEGEQLPYDPLDATKVWDEEKYPLYEVGRMSLNRNPSDYADQVEKLAFAPTNLLEGIELSDDKLLQGRSFVYSDAQRYRLGPDYRKLPINRQESWTPNDMVTSGNGRELSGILQRAGSQKPEDFAQGGQRYHSMTPQEQEALVSNLAVDLAAVRPDIRQVVLGYLSSASAELGSRVASQIGAM